MSKNTTNEISKTASKKPANPTRKKRIIAQMVAGALLALNIAQISAIGVDVYNEKLYFAECEKLEAQEAQTYSAIKAMEDYQKEYTKFYVAYTTAYTEGVLSDDEYARAINTLNSNAHAFHYSIMSENPNLISLAEINQRKAQLEDTRKDTNVRVGVLTVTSICGLIANGAAGYMAHKLKKKEKQESSYNEEPTTNHLA